MYGSETQPSKMNATQNLRVYAKLNSPKFSKVANEVVDYILEEAEILKFGSNIQEDDAKYQTQFRKLMNYIYF